LALGYIRPDYRNETTARAALMAFSAAAVCSRKRIALIVSAQLHSIPAIAGIDL